MTTKPISELKHTHPEYRPDLIEMYQDLYEGGERFEKRKNKYLRFRALEKSGMPAGRKLRDGRLDSATYTPHVSGLMEFLLSACMQAEPAILASGPEAKTAYYNGLNSNADGRGTDLPALIRSRMLEGMLQFRSCLTIVFPEDGSTYTDLQAQREAGALDAHLGVLDAKDIDDWECDEEGELLWVRTHTQVWERSKPYGARDTAKHIWAFITPTETTTFVARRSADDERKDYWPKDANAVADDPKPHSLGALPVVMLDIPKGLHVMARLANLVIGLFNREASEDYALDSSAYALPVLFTQKDISKIVLHEMAALKLEPNDKFEWSAPGSSHFAALADNAERKKESLYGAVQAMALQAAQKDSNGRQSGVAKFRDYGAIANLCSAFAAAARDALEKSIRLIQRARGDEDVTITISGLDRFDIQSIELLLKECAEFMALPAPQTAKRYALQKTSLALCADAPAEIREKIRQEAETLDVPPVPRAGSVELRQENTQEVKDFSTTIRHHE